MITKEVTTPPVLNTSTIAPIPKAPIQNPTPRKINYKYAGRETLSEIIRKATPKQLIPTKRMSVIFGGIFIFVLIIAIFQFPFSALMSGSTEIVIGVGYPWTFLELGVATTTESPVRVGGLVLDLLLYIILAYAIDISINLILRNPIIQSKENAKKRPVIFKNQKPSITEKTIEKIVEKTQ